MLNNTITNIERFIKLSTHNEKIHEDYENQAKETYAAPFFGRQVIKAAYGVKFGLNETLATIKNLHQEAWNNKGQITTMVIGKDREKTIDTTTDNNLEKIVHSFQNLGIKIFGQGHFAAAKEVAKGVSILASSILFAVPSLVYHSNKMRESLYKEFTSDYLNARKLAEQAVPAPQGNEGSDSEDELVVPNPEHTQYDNI